MVGRRNVGFLWMRLTRIEKCRESLVYYIVKININISVTIKLHANTFRRSFDTFVRIRVLNRPRKETFVLQSSMWRVKLKVYYEVNYERLGKLYENKLFVPIIRTIYVRR